MTASKGMLPLVLAGSIFVAGSGAIAGPSSPLDPYAYIQAPRPAVQPKAQPARAKNPSAALPGTGIMSGVKEVGGGIATTTKAAGSAVVNGTKKAGSGIVSGSKAMSGGIVSGTKKMGSGLAEGARNSGSFLVSGAKAVGAGIAAAGGKVKDGTVAAGAKIASAPKMFHREPKQKVAQNPRPAEKAQPEADPPAKEVEKAAEAPKPKAPANDDAGVMDKVVAVPKAIGGGIKTAAVKVKDGTGEVGKKVVALPMAMGRGVGKIFHRGGGDEAPKATAQGPGATK